MLVSGHTTSRTILQEVKGGYQEIPQPLPGGLALWRPVLGILPHTDLCLLSARNPPPFQEQPLRVCSGSGSPPSPLRMGLCADTGIHALHEHKQVCTWPPQAHQPLPTPMHRCLQRVPLHPEITVPGLGVFSGDAVFLPAAAQRADVSGEAAGTSINHSQMLLQRLQELLRQGNASDVVLRVQAAGTDEVRVFHAHRLLLGLHSELFRELLSNQSEVMLLEPRDCAAIFDKFIR